MERNADRIEYGEDDLIRIDEIEYRHFGSSDQGHRLQRADDYRLFVEYSHTEMAELEGSERYRRHPAWFSTGNARARERSAVTCLAEIPTREHPKILWKNEYVARFLELQKRGEVSSSNRGMEAAIAKIAEEVNKLPCAAISPNIKGKQRKLRSGTMTSTREPPSYRTLQRWLRTFKECAKTPYALRDNYRNCGSHVAPLEPEAEKLMIEVAEEYATQGKPSQDGLYLKLAAEIDALNKDRPSDAALTLPSKRQFIIRIRSLDKFWVYARRYTLEAAERKFAAVEYGLDVSRIGQRIEIDEWTVDLQTLLVRTGVWNVLSSESRKDVRRVRMCLYVAIDCASRCVLAMRLAPNACAAEAVATIRMIISDKSHLSAGANTIGPWFMSTGIGKLVTDWGSGYRSEECRRVVRSMGATFEHPPAGRPHLRGRVERMFSTIKSQFLGYFTGRTSSNVVEKGLYDPGTGASIPVDDLARNLVRYVVDDYHNRPHDGLGGETPRNAWIRLRRENGRLPVPDRHTQRAIFGIKTECVLDNSGVEILGLRYQSRELHDWFTRKGIHDVAIRLDPEDVGHASVLLGDDWLTVPCLSKEVRGLPLKVWQESSLDLSKRYADEAKLSRPILLATVRDLSAIGLQRKLEAGIAEELDTPETLEQARKALTFGFSLPNWDEDDREQQPTDLLDNIIPVPASIPGEAAQPDQSQTPSTVPAWRMGGLSEDVP
ncbi:Mu transposase C-terminal domain-containing protein [Methylobacterium sp. 13MFTsu3.1M2]|uniref:Mu transposase C-terminal domain-containing protein n=1 Tax=Methylobacterium sp. 13MFTsu3.1M2 TaxID=1502776 RepID=UPI000B84C273|nr:Mu transposase C-terminal domain-containing protein [Methylobacterium sp. 13MFTsu3.1M2]